MTSELSALLQMDVVEKPFSVSVNGKAVAPGRIGYSAICEKRCSDKPCQSESRSGEFICPLGLRYVSRVVTGTPVVVFGLAPLESRGPKNPSLKGRGFPRGVVDAWFQGLEELALAFEQQTTAGRTSALDAMHDMARMAVEVTNLANELVKSELRPGESIEDAPAMQLSVLKAAELLGKEFDRLELLFNPASAAVGKMYVHIYQLFHKYVIIMNLARDRSRAKRIQMKGRSDKTLHLYESISVLALALVENAVKYSFGGEVIDVEVVDVPGGVEASVRSTGPLIEDHEVLQIFDRGFRGRWAQKVGVEGRGLGLHLAKIVAEAHNTRIDVESRSLSYERDDVPVALNVFRVRLLPVA